MRLTAHLLGLVAEYRADGDIRYYLGGVHARPHPWLPGALICATNGHQLALAYDKDAHIEREALLRIDRPMIGALLKPKAGMVELRDGRLVVLSTEPAPFIGSLRRDLAALAGADEAAELFVQAGKGLHPDDWLSMFPKYDRLLPDPTTLKQHTICAGLNPEYLGKTAATGQKITRLRCPRGSMSAMVHMTDGDQDKGPTFTRFARAPELLLLTMGMRGDSLVDGEPEWVNGLRADHKRRMAEKEAALNAVARLQFDANNFINRDAEGLEP